MDPAQIAQLFTIKEAASILGLSIATLRRYDKIGALSPIRTLGNQRRYTRIQLEEFKKNKGKKEKPLTISEASKHLGVSIDTLRRYDKKGILSPVRTPGNQRRYLKEDVHSFLNNGLRPQNLIASRSVLTLAPIPVERKSLDYIRNFLRPAFLLLLPLIVVGAIGLASILFLYSFEYSWEEGKISLKKGVELQGNSLEFNKGRFNDKLSIGEASTDITDGLLTTTDRDFTLRPAGNVNFFTKSNSLDSRGNLVLEGSITASEVSAVYINASTFQGSGSLLTDLNGENITQGTISSARLPSDLSLLGQLIESSEIRDGTIANIDLSVGSYGNITGVGTLTSLGVGGNTTLGDDSGDTVVFNARVGSSIYPTSAYDLGSSSNPWGSVYANNIIPASSGTQGYWQRSDGSLAPTNITDDVLIGSTASSSAKFGFINVAGGTPAIQINGSSVLNPTTLGSGVVNSSLTSVGTLTLLNVSGRVTGKALVMFDETGDQDILTASASGVAKFSITNAGGIKLGTSEGTSGECVKSGGAGAAATFGTCGAGGGSNWRITSGALSPINDTLDVLIGNSATTSAKFAFINVNSGSPTASISGNLALAVPSGNDAAVKFDLLKGASLGIRTATTGQGDAGLAEKFTILNGGNVGIGDTSPAALLTVGSGDVFQVSTLGAITGITLDTGQGANELYDMDQNVLTTSAVTFATVDTGQGANELYDMDQNVLQASAVTFATLDTGQGANELYDMDQNVLTTSDVIFASATLNNTGLHILDTNASHDLIVAPGSDLLADRTLTLTTGDADRTITLQGNPTLNDWFDQSVKTTAAPIFATVDTGQGANELYDMDQNVLTTSTPQFARLGLGAAADATNILTVASASTTDLSKTLNITHTGAITGTGYAGYFSKTGASTTNVGLYATATGATNNYAAIFEAGNVGIGTTTPTSALTVRSTDVANIRLEMLNRAETGYNSGSIDIDPDGALDIVMNAYLDAHPIGSAAWYQYDTSRKSAIMMLDSQGDFNYYFSAAGASPAFPSGSSVKFEGETSNTVIGPGASGITSTTYMSGATGLLIYSSLPGLTFYRTSDATKWTNYAYSGILTWYDGSDEEMEVDASGNLYIDGSYTGPADYAEYFETNDTSIDKGELVSIDPENKKFIKKATINDSNILGIISTKPGVVGLEAEDITADNKALQNNPRWKIVGLLGQVPTKVSTENGPIMIGDYLTGSSIPGVAMKATKPGRVVARALEPYNGSGVGKISSYVSATWYDPDVYLTDSGNLSIAPSDAYQELGIDPKVLNSQTNKTVDRISAFKESVVGKIRAGIIEVTTITTDSLNIKTDQVKIGDKTLAEYIAQNSGGGSSERNQEVQAQITELQDQVASISAVLGVATESAELQALQDSIAQKEQQIASLSASSVQQLASSSGDGKFEKLRVTGSGLIEGVFTVLDSLNAQNLIVNGISTFFGEVVFKDQVKFQKGIVLAKDNAGIATLPKNNNSVKVVFSDAYDRIPIVNATLLVKDSIPQDLVYGVKDVSEKGFTLVLNQQAEEDMDFSWIAIAVTQ